MVMMGNPLLRVFQRLRIVRGEQVDNRQKIHFQRHVQIILFQFRQMVGISADNVKPVFVGFLLNALENAGVIGVGQAGGRTRMRLEASTFALR